MSTTIDERVVEMRFDNKQFESNVQTSLNTLDNLKKGLDLSGVAKGLSDISNTAKNFTLDGLASGVETVQTKFSYLQATIQHQLNNIVDSAVNAGKRIASALTIDPIKTGFSEYETQINAVQTILANTQSKGTTLDDVNKALDELNTYADKTIYNFTEMTKNIGTFTAAGVDLDTSVQAIQGIANLAAISGSTSQQASTAMYQLSQALSSGTVKLMDWNSVVNAGMGGQVFQDALKETARVHGIAIDELIESEGSFRETLSEGWLTSDILTETLAKFTMATEGLTDAQIDYQRTILKGQGYTDEQIASIFELGNTATNAATKVKTFTQLFDTLKESAQSGWTQSWEIIVGDFEEAKTLLTEISDIIGGLINASSNARVELLQGWKDLGGRNSLIESARNSFEGIMSIIKPISEAFREIFPATTAEQLFNITKALEDFTSKLKLSETDSKNLKRTFKGLFAVLDIVKQAFSAVWNVLSPYVSKIDDLGSAILEMTANWGDWLVNLNQSIKDAGGFTDVLNDIMDFFNSIIANPGEFFNSITDGVTKFVEKMEELVNILGFDVDFSEFKPFEGLLERIKERFSGIKQYVTDAKNTISMAFSELGIFLANCKFIQVLNIIWTAIKDISTAIVDMLGGAMSGLASEIGDANFDSVFDGINTASFGAIAAAIVSFLKTAKDAVGEGGFFANLVGVLEDVRGCLEAYQTSLKSGVLLKIAGAVGILAASLFVIALIDSEKLTGALGGITVLFGELAASMAVFSKLSGSMSGIGKMSVVMIATGAAVLILASALKKIGELDLKDIGEGLLGVGGLLAELAAFLKVAKFDKGGISASIGIVILSSALNVLANACKKIGGLDLAVIGKGLLGIGALLAEVAVFTKASGSAQHILSTGLALLAISGAMLMFASAINSLGTMEDWDLEKGLLGMAAALAEVTLAVNLMPKNLPSIGVGLLLVSTAMNALALSLKLMGTMSGNEIAASLTVMGIALAEFAIALNLMKNTLAGSAALLVAAAAIAVLTPSLILLGAMSWESIAKSLIVLAGAFVILGVAGAVLGPLAPAILAVSGALTLMGVGIAAIGVGVAAVGVGLMEIATAFGILSTISATGAMAIVTALTVIVTGVAGLIPVIIKKIGEAIIAFCGVIIDGAPAIVEAFIVIVESIIKALIEATPLIVEGIFKLLTAIFETIDEYTPKLVQLAYDILISMLEKIAANIGQVVQAGVDIVIGFIEGISSKLPDIVQAGFDMLLNFINGITECINTNTPLLIEAISGLVDALVNAAVQTVTGGVNMFVGAGGDLINGLIKGLGDGLGTLLGKVKEIGTSILTTIKDVLGINSPSKEFATVGRFADEGLIVGMEKYAGKVNDVAGNVGSDALDSMSNAISGIADSVDGNIDYQPTIRPVLDLTNVESGAGRLSSMLNQNHVASIAGSYRTPSQIAAETESTESMISRISARYADQLSSILSKSNTPVNLQVTLEGDAAKVFKLVRTENDKFIKSAGYSPL